MQTILSTGFFAKGRQFRVTTDNLTHSRHFDPIIKQLKMMQEWFREEEKADQELKWDWRGMGLRRENQD